MYIMLIGSPGTRKSSAIKLVKKIVQSAGYSTIAADKTTKEKWLLDLALQHEDEGDGNEILNGSSILDKNLFGADESDSALLSRPPAECFIMADEFNDFLGNGNIEFISLLGVLWDYEGVYRNRIKTGKSVNITHPTVSILSGNTPTNFSLAFPPEIIGQGFFSRLLLIYGEPTGRKITFPKMPSPEETSRLVAEINTIRDKCRGIVTMDSGAEKLLDKIYTSHSGIDDFRFESYSNRRFTHLLKLCVILTANRGSLRMKEEDVLLGNTILTFAENMMPKALGEFGRNKNGDVVQIVMEVLNKATAPVNFTQLWAQISMHFSKPEELHQIIKNLQMANKISLVKDPPGYLPRRVVITEVGNSNLVDFGLLTSEERNGV